MGFREFWSKWGNIITGLSIILFVVVAWTMMYQDRQIKKNIEENCGWEKEDYRCVCEQSDVIAMENKIKSEMGGLDAEAVGLVK